MKKRVLAAILTGIMLLGLVGCGSNEEASSESADTLKVHQNEPPCRISGAGMLGAFRSHAASRF